MDSARTDETLAGTHGHDPALDGVRGVAILLVMLYHFNLINQPTSTTESVVRAFLNVGWVGVDLFFVLSGFLITSVLVRSKNDDEVRASSASLSDEASTRAHVKNTRSKFAATLGRFYARRTLRIFPLYFLFLFASFVALPRLAPHIGNGGITTVIPDAPAWFLTYTSNFLFARDGAFVGGRHFHLTWSLSVEEQFYLVWPFLVLLLSRRRLRQTLVALIAFAFAARVILSANGTPWISLFVWPFTRMDTLSLGALVALTPRAQLERWRPHAFVVVTAWFLFAGVVAYKNGQYAQFLPITVTAGLTLNAFAGAALIALVRTDGPRGVVRRLMTLTPLRRLGVYAYGLYLTHVFAQHLIVGRFLSSSWFQRNFPDRLAAQFAFSLLCIVVSLTISIPLYHVFEQPFLRLKSRFQNSSSLMTRH